ncbi:MAG: hypothetical protein K2O62_05825, partial [Clostridia bacterium]|nr:hypothetical protein [Clostridia bacterium]
DPAYKFIKYRYYTVTTNSDGEYVKDAEITGGIDEVVKAVADGGLGASSTNLVQVYCEAYLDGMGKDNGVDPFVLKTSEKQKEYKVYYVGESKDAVDLTAGVSEIIYGNGGKALSANDLYELVIRDSGGVALGTTFYKVSLYDKDEKTCLADEIRATDGNAAYDLLKLGVGEYKLVFELINGADEDYILTSSNLPFTVKAVELTAPSLKEGVTFTYNGEVQSIINNLDGFDGEYMEFAVKAFNDGVKDAGAYTVLINIKEEYKGNYVFIVPDTDGGDITPDTALIKITVEKKEIALPTVGEIAFSGEYISLVDYLGGSYAEYKDIISISGDYRDIRNVSKNGYKARLVLTDPNYKWATPTTAEPVSKKLFAAKLFDNGLAIVDDVTAEISWNITPIVLDVSEMWVKGKNGATLN